MKELLHEKGSKMGNMHHIFKSYYTYVYYISLAIIKDTHIAEDITQETFLKAFHHIDTIHDNKKLGPWLKTIATRTSIDYLRKNNQKMKVLTDSVDIENIQPSTDFASSNVEEILENKDNYLFLVEKINSLKKEYRDIILLKYRYDLKNIEIAELLGITASTVKTRLYRARHQLRLKLNKCPTVPFGY